MYLMLQSYEKKRKEDRGKRKNFALFTFFSLRKQILHSSFFTLHFFSYLCNLMEKVKVLIVGAGPAGSTCGLLLKKRNIDCLLIDRAEFPRDKICGGGLTPRSYHLLNDLLPTFRYDYNSVNRLRLLIEGEPVFNLNMAEELRIVKRREFDARLLAEYKSCGGAFANEALDTIEENDGQIVVTMRSGRQVVCDYLVGADGSNSRVRKYLKPKTDHKILCLEQYATKTPDNTIVVNLSGQYLQGYYYVFPNDSYDVQGFGDHRTTPQSFRDVLSDMNCPDLKAKGAYINLDTNYPLHNRIILIGDAGGFANQLTFEGIYYAFLTACNAAEAISSGQPFAEVNRQVFKNKKKEKLEARLFYSHTGLWLLKLFCKRWPSLIKWCYDKSASKK